jgi:energy-coupling factor transport system substrate-specific component
MADQISNKSTDNKLTDNHPGGGISTFEMVLFAMLGAITFCSKLLMEGLPNIHLIGMFTMLFALVFRVRGLIPLYIFVFLTGLYAGFNVWWIPYLYIWTVLWGVTMLLPKNMSWKAQIIVYPIVCALHGLCYGTLYAPAQALFFHLSFKGMLAWIAVGLKWDLVHAAGNLCAGMLVYPLKKLMLKLMRGRQLGN